eukprot:TRINITY_DN4181_c0_g2_i1.p1 TRINITY_DN4181_c0_g2~~TRINITY_DN4181_c0_g2_i1.p1  ORF type:complete len:565 (-),score=79.04 TRINITY_DN4181_c0_g2_i1:137-1831(-)
MVSSRVEIAHPLSSLDYQRVPLSSDAFVDGPFGQAMESDKGQSRLSRGREPSLTDGGSRHSQIRRSFIAAVEEGNADFAEGNIGATGFLHEFNMFREISLGVVILANCVTMGLELDYPWAGWSRINIVFLIIYSADLVFLLAYHGTRFASSWWNWADAVVVASSALETTMAIHRNDMHGPSRRIATSAVYAIRMLRLLKVFRFFGMVPCMRPLFNLLSGVSAAVGAITWLLVLTFFFLYAFALIFTVLLGHGVAAEEFATEEMREHAATIFATVPLSLFALFRALFSNLTDFGYILQDTAGGVTVPLFYVIFQAGASWILFSTVTAAVVDNVTKVTKRNEKAEEFQEAQATNGMRVDNLSEFLSDAIELTPCDEITREALVTFLDDPGNLEELRRICGVDRAHAFHVWEAMESGGDVQLDAFVEKLLMTNDIEYVVARLDARVQKLQTSVDQSQLYLPMILEAICGSSSFRPLSLNHKSEGVATSTACTLCGRSSGLSRAVSIERENFVGESDEAIDTHANRADRNVGATKRRAIVLPTLLGPGSTAAVGHREKAVAWLSALAK